MPPHSHTHTLYIPWVYILKQLLMEIYGRCSLTRPRTLLILNYIMLHHTIIFNLELHVQISKRCICGSENSSKIKIAIKNEKFWAEKAVRLSIIHGGNDWKIAQTSHNFLATETAMCRSTRIYCIIFLSILSYDMIKSF